jgi:rfaE bifunctional protein nucleotidyltransferase chain/domain
LYFCASTQANQVHFTAYHIALAANTQQHTYLLTPIMTTHQRIVDKIMPLSALRAKAQTWRKQQERIVFSNGCFDLLHQGHIHTLTQAADQGTKLVVGLNSDQSVRQLKGDSRPVQDQQTRALFLASLFWVDAVVIFDQATPYDLIAALEPDVLVKGGDYDPNTLVGADLVRSKGGTVLVIPLLAGFSTTKTIEQGLAPKCYIP